MEAQRLTKYAMIRMRLGVESRQRSAKGLASMDAYDPIARLKHVLAPEAASTLLEGCLQLLDAQTLDEVLQAEQVLDALAATLNPPHDAIAFAFARIADYARRKRYVLQHATHWARQQDPHARAVEIIPSAWRVRVRVAEVDQWILVRLLHDEYLAYFDYTTEEDAWSTEIEAEKRQGPDASAHTGNDETEQDSAHNGG
jgi:hypothetical protein